MRMGIGTMTLFLDREDAGRRLGMRLAGRAFERPLVLALPRGGVEVGFEVATALHAPLDVIVARKLGAPDQPELAIGAIAPGVVVLNERIVEQLGVSRADVEALIAEETAEMERRAAAYRGGRPALDVTDRAVILVDDGLATGATAAAAIRSIRAGRPARIVLAVPVAAAETVSRISEQADEVMCLAVPTDFRAVGQWYEDFGQTSDRQVIELLERAGTSGPKGAVS